FTLIEVLIALAVFSIGILAVAKMQGHAIKGNYHGRTLSEATTKVSDQIEYLLSLPYDDMLLDDDDADGLAGLDDINPSDGNFTTATYSVFWNVADDQPAAGAKTIRFIVTWWENGRSHSHDFNTIKVDL
ncbi:MAG TPA: prepilin-type N-terminal cleavage/methylation domain-containing protein, partial [Thermodesulfobacteriaceae bacterium]|nr:prepilin-type N-terminal cleavage/methylation domain-containing protein [Thermodesulfobacteriaceae bacterium]